MGAAKAQRQEKQQGSRRGRRNGTGARVTWATVNGEMLAYTIAAVAQKGGALRFGYTRDGGAFAIGIYGDGDPYTDYVRPGEDIESYLRELSNDFGNVSGDGSYMGDDPK